MKNLIFFCSNQVGDAALSLEILESLSQAYPNLKIYFYNKNGNSPSGIILKHPNVKSCEKISTKIFTKSFYQNTFSLYKQIKLLLQESDVHISSLLGMATIFFALSPFLLWLKFTEKNKVILMQSTSKWFKHDGHLVNFHLALFSKTLGKTIEYTQNSSIFQGTKNPTPKTIAILPGASRIWKSLSAEKFAYIANHFAKNGYKITVLGSNSKIDTNQATKIMELSSNKFENLTGKTTLDQYINTIASSSYVICNDSSGQHIAHLCQTPVAVLWGRNKYGQIAKSYSWQNKLTLNIFNNPYKHCPKCTFLNKFKSQKRILQSHQNCEACINQNLEALNNDEIIKQIESHINFLSQ